MHQDPSFYKPHFYSSIIFRRYSVGEAIIDLFLASAFQLPRSHLKLSQLQVYVRCERCTVTIVMAILVKLHGRFRTAAGVDQIEMPATIASIGELLGLLSTRFGSEMRACMFVDEAKNLNPNLLVLVNEHSVRMLKGLSTPISDNDTVLIDSIDIIEIVGGG